jgi:hypothetical protein
VRRDQLRRLAASRDDTVLVFGFVNLTLTVGFVEFLKTSMKRVFDLGIFFVAAAFSWSSCAA